MAELLLEYSNLKIAERAYEALKKATLTHRSTYKLRKLRKRLDFIQTRSEADSITGTDRDGRTEAFEATVSERRRRATEIIPWDGME